MKEMPCKILDVVQCVFSVICSPGLEDISHRLSGSCMAGLIGGGGVD